ncbi:DNA-directed RNA polymerase subunit delta [Agrilactobacillus fermenti]|uniref:DNA-directed RNA polymerase subunit delta n=1 Tax=Agrilactobacillus fermenti TaxID=2586909 RepID=UPI0038B3C195|nr:DNA-directed RNA polymerase subunit delta [Agrilactobacillus fermenti]
MDLDIFKGQEKSELSMIEVAHAILEQKTEPIAFADLVNAIQTYLGKSDTEIRSRLSQFYTDLNIDGRFISLGENVWGLREWYPYDSVDEEVNHPEDEDGVPRRKRRKKVNAFLADVDDDDDVIDYNDDDPEDDDFDDTDDDDTDNSDDLDAFDADIDDVDADADDDLPDGIEGQLSEFGDDDDDSDDDGENEGFGDDAPEDDKQK